MTNVEYQTVRRTFAMETGLTDGIVRVIADIVKHSSTSFAEKKKISDKYYEIFRGRGKRNKQEIESIKKPI